MEGTSLNVSLVTVCKNEFNRLENWYNYHLTFFDDIVVVDQKSTDETPLLKNKINIIEHDKSGWCELSREYACSLAKNDWILFLDIDEKLVMDKSFSFSDFIHNNDMCGYKVYRDNYIDNNLREIDRHYRFFNRTKSIFYTKIHTQIKPNNLLKSSEINRELFYIEHDKSKYEQDLDDNRYMELGCQHKR